VLTGEGADEFLAGYEIFKEAKVRRFVARGPESSWRGALLKRLYPYVGDLTRSRQGFLERYFRDGADGNPATQSHNVRWRNTARTKRLFSAAMRAAVAAEAEHTGGLPDAPPLPGDFAQWSPLARAQYLEATIFLPGYLMSSQGDRMVMSHSVEGRYPFLDPELIEFCNRLSPRLKLCGLDVGGVRSPLAPLTEASHERLEATLNDYRERLQPETVARVERNLQVIDRAIRESLEALDADPGSALLRSLADRALQRKVEFLRGVSQVAGRAL